MNQERLLKIILAPIFSEKATRLADSYRQYAFRVASDASKPEIKAAVESLFDVKVKSIAVLNVKGKKTLSRPKRPGGRRSSWRKAYVSLQEGHEIDFVGG